MNDQEYASALRQAVSSQDGNALSTLLSVQKTLFVPSQLNFISSFPPPWQKALMALCQARQFLASEKLNDAYEAQISGVLKFQEIFRNETSWLVPALHVLTYETRLIAMQADAAKTAMTRVECHDLLRNAEQQLKKGFSLALNDRTPGPGSKKSGALYIVNQLFKIYFKLNTIRLCRNLIRAVEGPGFPNFEVFAKADRVTYKFYVGRIAMFEDDYPKAEACLDYAAMQCHRRYRSNVRLILQFLIPVKMLLGQMPSMKLLQMHELVEFKHLVQAVKGGNISLFDETLSTYQDQFVKQGIYLIVEKLRILTYRNLFKKVWLATGSHQIKLAAFELSLKLAGASDTSLNEVECILANLIYNGYIKGYISHQQSVVVLSKKEAFPKIAKVMAK